MKRNMALINPTTSTDPELKGRGWQLNPFLTFSSVSSSQKDRGQIQHDNDSLQTRYQLKLTSFCLLSCGYTSGWPKRGLFRGRGTAILDRVRIVLPKAQTFSPAPVSQWRCSLRMSCAASRQDENKDGRLFPCFELSS